ncbi:MAG: S-methyl-5-thioribose-1-phosphate isomerase [Deltaproteobacteria bacterium]|nr:S-methyl-5-thioribose-1-phosphate isomerase [Deltaproteobacteria bacterium]
MADVRAFKFSKHEFSMLDQRALPTKESWLSPSSVEETAVAIETLAVRGAPAIGGAAALGMAFAAKWATDAGVDDVKVLRGALLLAEARLARTRPTAVNLFFALKVMREVVDVDYECTAAFSEALFQRAKSFHEDDAAYCVAMGEYGAPLFDDGDVVLTICHTGSLATCGQGTALGVLKTARAQGKRIKVLALETRPLLQGARLTAWECQKVGLDVELLTDSMAAYALANLGVTKAIAGADRIAKNGDTANKIGTYGLATLCAAHEVPMYIAAPSSTFDLDTVTGEGIEIEERHPDEVRAPRGAIFAPKDVPVQNPAFDVTPHRLLAGIVTERGIWRPPFSSSSWSALMNESRPT